MMFFLIMFVLYYKNSFTFISPILNITELNKPTTNSGNDERYIVNKTNDQENKVQLYKIYQSLEKKKLLDKLQDKNLSIITKLDLLQDNSIKSPNFTAGGLFDDYDFTF